MHTEILRAYSADFIASLADREDRRAAIAWNVRLEIAERKAGRPLRWERLSRDHGQIVIDGPCGFDRAYGRDEGEALDRFLAT